MLKPILTKLNAHMHTLKVCLKRPMHVIFLFTSFQFIQCLSCEQEILDCDQSNVLLARIIFFCILLRAFSFLSACIRDPASN